jgi:hypothetical protein
MIDKSVKAGQYVQVFQIAQTIEDKFAKAETLEQIATQAVESGQFDILSR